MGKPPWRVNRLKFPLRGVGISGSEADPDSSEKLLTSYTDSPRTASEKNHPASCGYCHPVRQCGGVVRPSPVPGALRLWRSRRFPLLSDRRRGRSEVFVHQPHSQTESTGCSGEVLTLQPIWE